MLITLKECYPVSYLYVPLSFSEIAMAAHLFILQQLVVMLAFSMVSYKSQVVVFTWTITDTRRFTGLVLTVRTNAPFVRIEQHNLLVEASTVNQTVQCLVGYTQSRILTGKHVVSRRRASLSAHRVSLPPLYFYAKIEPAGTRNIIFEDEPPLTLGSGKQTPTESATPQQIQYVYNALILCLFCIRGFPCTVSCRDTSRISKTQPYRQFDQHQPFCGFVRRWVGVVSN